MADQRRFRTLELLQDLDAQSDRVGPVAARLYCKLRYSPLNVGTEAKLMATPLSMRLPEQDLAIIDRAAGLRGRSRTDFVREAAVRAAEEVLLEQSIVRLDPVNFEAFKAALDAPPRVVPEMAQLLKRRAPWEQ